MRLLLIEEDARRCAHIRERLTSWRPQAELVVHSPLARGGARPRVPRAGFRCGAAGRCLAGRSRPDLGARARRPDRVRAAGAAVRHRPVIGARCRSARRLHPEPRGARAGTTSPTCWRRPSDARRTRARCGAPVTPGARRSASATPSSAVTAASADSPPARSPICSSPRASAPARWWRSRWRAIARTSRPSRWICSGASCRSTRSRSASTVPPWCACTTSASATSTPGWSWSTSRSAICAGA